MKIGLIGINKYAEYLNFACDLHAYAFQQFLDLHGYESTFLDYRPVDVTISDLRRPAAEAEQKYRDAVMRKEDAGTLSRLAELAMGYRSAAAERERRFDKFAAFVKDNLRFTEARYDSDLLEIEDPGFDCYICVTDVIWQSLRSPMFDRGFFLASKAFEGKHKIAYAASRGAVPDFPDSYERLFFQYLRDINTISVREQDFSEYIESHSHLSATKVLDPVLLHGGDFWGQIAIKPREERYLLLYYVMEKATDTIAKAIEYAKLHDLTIVELSDRPFKFGKVTDPSVKHIPRYDIGMEEWLGYIQHAEAVFTNSFHGCCFTLLFENVLFVGNRNGRKVPNFLEMFGLSDRRFGPETDVCDLSPDIDYRQAFEVLGTLRRHSEDFILTALAEAENRTESGESPDVSEFDQRRRSLEYRTLYHSGIRDVAEGQDQLTVSRSDKEKGVNVKRLKSGALEYSGGRCINDGSATIQQNLFRVRGQRFAGWSMRFRIDRRWFWYLSDGSIEVGNVEGSALDSRKAVLRDRQAIPHLPVNRVDVVVFVARWERSVLPAKPRLTRFTRLKNRLQAEA